MWDATFAGLQELPALAGSWVMKCAHPGWSRSGTVVATPPPGVQNNVSPFRHSLAQCPGFRYEGGGPGRDRGPGNPGVAFGRPWP